MGSILSVTCECGLEANELYVGFGMHDCLLGYAPASREAAACDDCHAVVLATMHPDFAPCPRCRQNLAAMPDGTASCRKCGISFIADGAVCPACLRGKRRLLTADRMCPRCRNRQLSLRVVGIWD